MQLFAKLKGKQGDEKTDPLKGASTTSIPETKARPSILSFGRSRKSSDPTASATTTTNTSSNTSPATSNPSSPNVGSTFLPTFPLRANSQNATTPAHPQTTSTQPQRQPPRPMYRTPSIMYCPVLDKDGNGYGNENARRSTVL